MPKITLDELLAALQDAEHQAAESNGWTMKELADVWGVHQQTARMRVQAGIRDGWIRCIGREPRLTVSGHMHSEPVYQVDRLKRKRSRWE